MLSPIDQCLANWQPPPSWDQILQPAFRTLEVEPEDGLAWARIAMVLGDTHQPVLCFVVCAHARALGQPEEVDRRLSSHQALASMDLDNRPRDDGAAWLAEQLSATDNPAFVCKRLLDRLAERFANS